MQGWEKDFKTENPLSAIQVLIKNGAKQSVAMSRVIKTHNELVRRCVQHAQLIWEVPSVMSDLLDADGVTSPGFRTPRSAVFKVFRQGQTLASKQVETENLRKYVRLILGFANGMAMWMAVSKRYMV